VVADSHHFEKELVPDADADSYLSVKLNPDPEPDNADPQTVVARFATLKLRYHIRIRPWQSPKKNKTRQFIFGEIARMFGMNRFRFFYPNISLSKSGTRIW
jgi:hypothetical protein